MATLPISKGIDGIPTTSIPQDPQAFVTWFTNVFIRRWLSLADVRNATQGAGVTITGTTTTPATISVASEITTLLEQPFVLASPPVAGEALTDYRLIAAQAGVLSLTDGGAESTLTVGVAANGIGNTQLRQGAAASIIGNATNTLGNVADIAASTDGYVLLRTAGTLGFGLPATQASQYTGGAIATGTYTYSVVQRSMATVPLANITGGTYNFQSLGSGATLLLTVSGGVITGLNTVLVAGSGYSVGDVVQVALGNQDNFLLVTSVSSGGIAGITVLYGGTGNGSGPVSGSSTVTALQYTFAFTFELAGALTSNATIIMTAGSLLVNSNQWNFCNNTTGAYTVTVKLSNGAGGSTGTGVVIPQGSNNSTSVLLFTNGITDVWRSEAAVSSHNPTATIGLSAVNGTALTYMTSDSAPPLSQAITPTWTGVHAFSAGMTISGVPSTAALSVTAGSGAQGLHVTGVNSTPTAVFQSGTTTGDALGVEILAGSDAADYALKIFNAAGGAVLLELFGDGGAVLGAPTGGDEGSGTLNVAGGLYVNGTAVSTAVSANPSATIGLSAVNGTAATWMTSDSAPALSQAIVPTWTGAHTWSSTATFNGATSFASATNLAVTFGAAASSYTVLEFEQNSVINGYVGVDKGGSLITGSSSGDLCITPNTGTLRLGYNNGAGTALSVSSAGLVTTPLGLTATTAVTLGAAASKTVGFYGATPAAQRATTSAHSTTNVVSSSAYNSTANQKMVAILQEVMNTLYTIGIWADH